MHMQCPDTFSEILKNIPTVQDIETLQRHHASEIALTSVLLNLIMADHGQILTIQTLIRIKIKITPCEFIQKALSV